MASSAKKTFDIALLCDAEEKYKFVLLGPIEYIHASKTLEFDESQRYLTGDVNVANEAANFVQTIDCAQYITGYTRQGEDVTAQLPDIVSLQLFKFKPNKPPIRWQQHVEGKRSLKLDVLILVSSASKPLYIVRDADCQLLSKRITCSSCRAYERNDAKLLDEWGAKHKTFGVDASWHVQHLAAGALKSAALKTAIGYKFGTASALQQFVRQSYDVALMTGAGNAMKVLLNEVVYDVDAGSLTFAGAVAYGNGYYGKLKESGEHFKSVQPKEYRHAKNKTDSAHEFDFAVQHCLLFKLHAASMEAWVHFIAERTTQQYDLAVASDAAGERRVFLNKVQVDWMDRVLLFGAAELFADKHTALVQQHARQLEQHAWREFEVGSPLPKGMEAGSLSALTLFKWDFNKKETQAQAEEHKQSSHLSVGRPKLTASKSHGEAVSPKKKRTKSALPSGLAKGKKGKGKGADKGKKGKGKGGDKDKKRKGKTKGKGSRLGVAGDGHRRRKSASPATLSSQRNSRSVKIVICEQRFLNSMCAGQWRANRSLCASQNGSPPNTFKSGTTIH